MITYTVKLSKKKHVIFKFDYDIMDLLVL